MRPRQLALVLALVCGMAGGPARAEEEAELADWKQQLEQAEADLLHAREQAASAHAAYVHMRHDPSMRGEEKAKIIASRAETEHAVSDAQARLEALREEARRDGVPPAWILTDPPAEADPES